MINDDADKTKARKIYPAAVQRFLNNSDPGKKKAQRELTNVLEAYIEARQQGKDGNRRELTNLLVASGVAGGHSSASELIDLLESNIQPFRGWRAI